MVSRQNDSQWRSVELDGGRFLASNSARTLCLFGVGRPGDLRSAEERALRLLSALEPRVRAVRWGRQVHGAVIETVSRGRHRGAGCVGDCDGLTTAETGVALLVWTADCVPVLLAGDGAVAVVHAGWRGAAAGIVGKAVAALGQRHGQRPAEISAWLGPSVGACHYPVGAEVVAALGASGIATDLWCDGGRVDLRSLLAEQLARGGVTRVERVGGCTACSADLASYRRDGPRAGRQLSLVLRRAGEGPAAAISPSG